MIGAAVLDANIPIAIMAQEVGEAVAQSALERYTRQGYELFAPGLIVSETLYVLCGKLHDGTLSSADHSLAITGFDVLMQDVRPTPDADGRLILRAEAIRGSYTCRRSADGVYIALAELLTASRPTILLTFDEEHEETGASLRAYRSSGTALALSFDGLLLLLPAPLSTGS